MNTVTRARIPVVLVLVLGLLAGGCSVKRLAIRQVGNALAAGGGALASDDDPELIRAAAPFSLKLMESLLAEVPDHRGLRAAAASGFAQYAYAFVQQEADELEETDFAAAEAMRDRARRLYRRARDHGLQGLEAAHRGFLKELRADPFRAVDRCVRTDVPLLYWTAAAWGAVISLSKDDPMTVGEIPQMEALIDRAFALDEGWDEGALHTFLIRYELSRSDGEGPGTERARRHFLRALELSAGRQAAPWVAYAESVSLQAQDRTEFEALLIQALAIDPDAFPEHRLANLILQRRARWLWDQREDLFIRPAGR